MPRKDISKLCRCCMENGEFNIFSTLFDTQTIVAIMEECVFSKISSDDCLPKAVCQNCLDKLVSFYTFLTNYKRVQTLLLDYVENGKSIIENECNLHVEEVSNNSKVKCENSDDDQPLSVLYKQEQRKSRKCIDQCIINDELVIQNTIKLNFKSKTDLETNDLKDSLKPDTIGESKKFDITNNKLILNVSSIKQSKFLKKDLEEDVEPFESNSKGSILKHYCSDCTEHFHFVKHLEKHCKDTGHSFPRKFTCDICSKKFISNTHLNDHMRIHNNERPYSCNECDMSFTLSSNLKRHKKRHTGEKSHFCEVCGRGFIQKHTLTIHMRLHNGETPYVCELCGKGYRAKSLLHQHMFKHRDTEIQAIKYQKYYLKYGKVKVECKVCKKTITKSALYNHMKVQHGDGPKKFLCNLCGKTYATKMSLDVHMNVHTKKISYDCNVCSKSFTHQNYLKTHLMLHSGERPHCCNMCGKTFVQRTHLDRHMRTHTGIRPYVCSYCGRAFALNENLKVHIRIHTGETPHHCSICDKGFFNSSSRKKHEARAHQLK